MINTTKLLGHKTTKLSCQIVCLLEDARVSTDKGDQALQEVNNCSIGYIPSLQRNNSGIQEEIYGSRSKQKYLYGQFGYRMIVLDSVQDV